jgi:hypothetical protein
MSQWVTERRKWASSEEEAVRKPRRKSSEEANNSGSKEIAVEKQHFFYVGSVVCDMCFSLECPENRISDWFRGASERAR